VSSAAACYDVQADAILYLDPGAALTTSCPDSALSHWGCAGRPTFSAQSCSVPNAPHHRPVHPRTGGRSPDAVPGLRCWLALGAADPVLAAWFVRACSCTGAVRRALPACVRRRRLEGPVSHAPPFSGAAWISSVLDIHAAPAATPRSLDPGDRAIGALMSRDIAAPQDRAKTRRLNYHPDG